MGYGRRFKLAAVLLLTACVTTGCIRSKVLERLGLVIASGFDEVPGDKIMGTSVLYEIDPQAREKSNVISSTAYTLKGPRTNMNYESRKKLASGQLRVMVYHEDLARKGLIELVDTLSRDPDIGTGIYLTVTKGKAFDLFTRRYPEIANIGNYLFQSIKQNVESEAMVSPILHEFMRDYYDPGQDPVLPYIEQHGNEIIINGAALFAADRMVDTLPMSRLFYLRLIRDRFRSGYLEVGLPAAPFAEYAAQPKNQDRIYLVLDNIISNSRIELVGANPPTYRVEIRIRSRLQEQSVQLPLEDPRVIRTLEQQAADEIKNISMDLIKQTQKLNVDPFGFGNKYRAHVRGSGLTKDKWRELYPAAKFNLKVKVKILRTGQTD
ncbi:Ger(x)C family spore germination protein [Paenibacillus sp. P26]|nr:Ger(x)C family spore germination protein [Paenibacillus sp. P26]